MPLKIHNTLTNRLEDFTPLTPGEVKMYVCGVTPYDYSHLGHARPAVVFDVIRRYFEQHGYKTTYIVNFTDIDDKIIARANEQGLDPYSYPEPFIEDYRDGLRRLNVLPATHNPRVTQLIGIIIDFIQKIIENGYGYAAGGDVYFAVRKFKSYGQLSNRSLDHMLEEGRVDPGPNKRDPLDFAVWKAAKPGEPYWWSPWGKGRPGWHIECSAMGTHYLGETFDIHGGGNDLIFPHHENEIAQSCAYSGRPTFANYWMHNGMVTMKEEKMSKSTGKFLTLRDLLDKYPADALRMFLLGTHYRSPTDFSEEAIEAYANRAARFSALISALKEVDGPADQPAPPEALKSKQDFIAALEDDFNTPNALAALQLLLDNANQGLAKGDGKNAAEVGGLMITLGRDYLGLFQPSQNDTSRYIEPLVNHILALRDEARKNKNFALSDQLRKLIADSGVIVEDTPQGVRWRLP